MKKNVLIRMRSLYIIFTALLFSIGTKCSLAQETQFFRSTKGIPVAPVLTADPNPPGLVAGALYYNSVNTRFRLFNGTSWQDLIANYPPAVDNVNISGDFAIGGTVTGSYSYCDAESDAESGTSYQWYYAADVSGTNATVIAGATSASYTIASPVTEGKYIRLGITPGASSGTSPGIEKYSNWTLIPPCGSSISVNHTAGEISAQTLTITYGTVNFNGKCWITQNLGAAQQATSATDDTGASAGWYWQFNRKQGFYHPGPNGTTTGLSPTWTTPFIEENSNWLISNDPCRLLLGGVWRLPTPAEWTSADNTWNNYNDTYNSVLKIHAAGYLDYSYGELKVRGSEGYYWGSSQYGTTGGYRLKLTSSSSAVDYLGYKPRGVSVRCLRDN